MASAVCTRRPRAPRWKSAGTPSRGPRIEERVAARLRTPAPSSASRRSASRRPRAHPSVGPRLVWPHDTTLWWNARRRGPALPLALRGDAHGKENAKNLRLALQQGLAASNDFAAAARRRRAPTRPGLLRRAAGLTPGRASIMTALLAGCIPCSSRRAGPTWPLHWGGWPGRVGVISTWSRDGGASYVGDAGVAAPSARARRF